MTHTARTFLGTALAMALAVAFVLVSPLSARAHGGPFDLFISPDGAGGVALYAQYVGDGHLVEEIIDPIVTAKASDGRTAGPVSLMSSSEGVGRWVSEEPFLDDGDWTVTVRTTTPDVAEATAEFTVAPLDAPLVAGAAAVEPAGEGLGMGVLLGLLGGGAVLVGGVIAAVIVRRNARERAA